jgi:DNA processing protein
MTFGSGFTKYYKQIIDGDVLVLSTFFPKAPWKAELAMARNPIIYGLADEIYVAESTEKGGTWSGVVDGLRKQRKIFVRQPEPSEKNANLILIQKGAVPVDFNGSVITKTYDTSIVEQVLSKLGMDWTTKKLIAYLKKLDFIEVIKDKKTNLYKIKGTTITNQPTLFK